MGKTPSFEEALRTWEGLNAALMATESEVWVRCLLEAERRGRNRARVLHRIHSRINRLRAARERRELGVA